MKELALFKESSRVAWRRTSTTVPLPASLCGREQHLHLHACDPFPLSQIFMLQLSAFDPGMFSIARPLIAPFHEQMVTSPRSPDVGDFNQKGLRYAHIPNGQPTNWPMRDHDQFELLAEVLNSALETAAHKPRQHDRARARGATPADFSKVNNPCGFMSTVRQHAQNPHTDTSKASIAAHRKFAENNGLSPDVLPWHVVIALSNGGRLIYFWGVEGDDAFLKSPILVLCPKNCILAYR